MPFRAGFFKLIGIRNKKGKIALQIETLVPQCVLKQDALLGEVPVWSMQQGVLYWLDVLNGSIHCFDPKKKADKIFPLHQIVSSLGLLQDGRLIVTLTDQIALFDTVSQELKIMITVEENMEGNRFNDGKCDRAGRFWCTTKNASLFHLDTAALYRVDANFEVHLMEKNIVTGNGMGWSPDNSLFYLTQTLRHTIFVYDFDLKAGSISNCRPFVRFKPDQGLPDGLTVDAEGFIWVALYGKGEVLRLDPQGNIDRRIQLPAPHVTNCTFGGENLDTLFITTAQENMNPDQIATYPLSGSLFALQPGIKGLLEPYFKV